MGQQAMVDQQDVIETFSLSERVTMVLEDFKYATIEFIEEEINGDDWLCIQNLPCEYDHVNMPALKAELEALHEAGELNKLIISAGEDDTDVLYCLPSVSARMVTSHDLDVH